MNLPWRKDPNDVLDYEFDFAAKTNGHDRTDFLASGETITSCTVTASPDGLTVESVEAVRGSTSVRFWLRGGDSRNYKITCEIVTSESRVVQRTNTVRVREK